MMQPGDHASRPRRLARGLCAALILAALAACSARTNTQGNVVDPQLLGQIKPGEQTKEQVQNLIGTPSSIATFDPNTWYYISKQTRRYAFLDPEVLEQKVIVVEFDKKGVVQAIHKYGEEDGRDVQVVSRTTPTRGHSLGVLDQIWATLLHQINNGADAQSRDPFMRR